MEKRRLTADEWAQARRRWEGDARDGFAWLAAEIGTAWGVAISRPALHKAASKGWTKGGAPSAPLEPASLPASLLASPKGKVTPEVTPKVTQSPAGKLGGKPTKAPVLSLVTPGAGKPEPEPPDSLEGNEGAADLPDSSEPHARTREPITVHPMDLGEGAARAVALEVVTAQREKRQTKYIPEACFVARRHCLLGAIDEELAAMFNIAESTLNAWKLKYPEFQEAIQSGKAVADARVAEALHTRATGYVAKIEKPMSVPIGQGQSVVEIVQFNEYVAPDQQAARYWLNNRQPDRWREKVTIEPEIPDTLPSAEFLAAIYERKMRTAAEKQREVAGRAERLGIVGAMQALLNPPSEVEPVAPDDDIEAIN